MVKKAVTAFITFLILYVLFPEVTVLFLVFAILVKDILWILIAIIYVIVLFYIITLRVHYDAKRLESIYIEEAPPFINKLLSETTNRGVLINQLIIKTIANKPMISQTKLYEEIKQIIGPRNCPVKEMIRQYLKKLEKAKIIKDISHETAQAREKPMFSLNVENGASTQLKDITQNISLFISLDACFKQNSERNCLPLNLSKIINFSTN